MKFKEAKETLNPDYRTFLYKKTEDGQILSEIFNIEDAIFKTANEGWRLSPAEFSENENLIDDTQFNQTCDEIARDRNMILNIEEIHDRARLEALLFRMFGVKVRSDMKLENVRKRIVAEAKLQELEGV